MEHEVIPPGEIHAPHNWVVADEAARLALVVTEADLGKYCWQRDNESQWFLRAHDPATWQPMETTVAWGDIVDKPDLIEEGDSRLTDSRTPTGGAGGVLSGSFPNPGFAVDMATQGEMDTQVTLLYTALDDLDAAKIDATEKGAANGVATLGADGKIPESQSPSAVRGKLTAARTYYVRTDGSDSNTGLVDSAGGAFLTIQKAVDVASAFDLNGFTVTIQVRDGTFTGVVSAKPYVGAGLISIDGNATTPANVLISTSSTSFNCTNCGSYRIRNMQVQASSGYAIFANGARTSLTLSGMVYGAMSGSGAHVYVTAQASVVQTSTTYSIVGGGYSHITVSEGGALESSLCTVTLTGTPAFSNYAFIENLSLCRLVSNTYSGSATGARYSVSGGSVIFTAGAGATALPGNATGTEATGGRYL